jgi:tetratricopeptide (TPR) repeat protein
MTELSDILTQATEIKNAGDLARATEFLTSALTSGVLVQNTGNLADATLLLASALAAGIENEDVYLNLAALLEGQKRQNDALMVLQEAITKHPHSARLLSLLGAVNIRIGDPAAAIPLLEKASTIVPDQIGSLTNLAVACAQTSDWTRAKAVAGMALSLDPHSIMMLQVMAATAIFTGDILLGLRTYDQRAFLMPLQYRAPNALPDNPNINNFSRAHPSPRYAALSEQYEIMHSENQGSDNLTFAGLITFLRVAPYIRASFSGQGLHSLLDYGGGQGRQYKFQTLKARTGNEFENMAAFLGVQTVDVYDSGRPDTASTLSKTYDAVICTDVLEHCDRQDLPWIIRELFERANKEIFATIATYPAGKHLPNGENAHCTLEPADWWSTLFLQAARDFPSIRYTYLVVHDSDFNSVEAFTGGPDAGR